MNTIMIVDFQFINTYYFSSILSTIIFVNQTCNYIHMVKQFTIPIANEYVRIPLLSVMIVSTIMIIAKLHVLIITQTCTLPVYNDHTHQNTD